MKYKAKNIFAMKTLVLLYLICISQVFTSENYLKPRDEKVNIF